MFYLQKVGHHNFRLLKGQVVGIGYVFPALNLLDVLQKYGA